MKGRKPKPTALKMLAGNPGKRPLPKDEPKVSGIAEKPAWLSEEAAKVWVELAPRTAALGLLSQHDAEQFGVLCTLAAEFREDGSGMNASRVSRLQALFAEFGMGPSARTRISSTPTAVAEDNRKYFGLA